MSLNGSQRTPIYDSRDLSIEESGPAHPPFTGMLFTCMQAAEATDTQVRVLTEVYTKSCLESNGEISPKSPRIWGVERG